ncbi:MAG: hypothetical protein ACYDAE_06435 [Steroidobacteraceae bacterium]
MSQIQCMGPGLYQGAGCARKEKGAIFRPSTPEDAPEILALFRKAGIGSNARVEDLQWKYWRPRDDWPGSRSYVMAGSSGIIAHGGVVAGIMSWQDRRARVIMVVDWAALPSATGAGVSLMKRIGRLTDVLLAIGGSRDTRAILPHLGFRPYPQVTGFVRPLRPFRILRSGGPAYWRLAARFARGVFWKAQAPSTRGASGDVRRIEAGQLAEIACLLPRPRAQMAVMERSASIFRHLLQCPMVDTELYLLEQSGRPRGYFLLTFPPGQARLADLWTASEDPDDWRSLILFAVRCAMRHPAAVELAAWSVDPEVCQRLRECGFHARTVQPVQLMAPPDFEAPPALHVQMIDSDHAYLHQGYPELWA